MSANRWSICPRCRRAAKAAQEQARKDAEAAYGKVSRQEYARLLKQAETEPLLRETLREDWHLGINAEGEFYIRYSACCCECPFKHEFKTTQRVGVSGNEEREAGQ